MDESLRIIITSILEGKIENSKDLEKIKHSVCRDYGLLKFPSNSEILKIASSEERSKIIHILKKKPTRTISGVAVVAVMCPPHFCPHGRCLYCPESKKAPPSYTGEEPAALRARMFNFHPYRQVYNRLLQLESIGHPLDKVELIIMGGTFPSQFLCFQEWFVTNCLRALVDFGVKKPVFESNIVDEILDFPQDFRYLDDVQSDNEVSDIRCVGMTFETRPDYSKIEDVDRMLRMGVTRVELGVQTIYNFIYYRIHRGHRVEDTIEAARILRDSGVKVAMHLMPGLFADQEQDLRMFQRIFSDERFKPDMLKIYPCLVTKGSELYELWKKGVYEPYSTEEAVDLIVEVKKLLPKWVRTMRIQRDIPSQLIEAGVKKSNLGELVYKKLEEEGVQCQCIRCREVGHQANQNINPDRESIRLFREEYNAGNGREVFLSIEDPENQVLLGFLRLRIPSSEAHRPEINNLTTLVRELHVYGTMLPIGKKNDELWQHKGFGEELLVEAERISREEYDRGHMLITSGIGTRNYYRKFGYERIGPYMSKNI
ncbi:MAG: tRNA uridine(34) 5-carboxymethylaminomethyl modification radical SAM/GNAT enzyme Elp3 [Methanobacteriaceae archaeon]